MPRRKSRSRSRGAMTGELGLTILPVLFVALGTFQLTRLGNAKLLVMHSAMTAGRSASVILPDDPRHYDDKEDDVRLAAVRALAPSIRSGTIENVRVDVDDGTQESAVTVRVRATFRCTTPLASFLVCGLAKTRELEARGTFPLQSASFAYE
jgi:Flp pilus assembly protein TadG